MKTRSTSNVERPPIKSQTRQAKPTAEPQLQLAAANPSDRLKNFWQSRYATWGHTGWSDCAIYAYDQLERAAIVERTLELLPGLPRTALDFGCGTGYFSKLLLRLGMHVWGYDPYVKPEIDLDGFCYISSPGEIAQIPAQLDIILSVTVLDHILDDIALAEVLGLLRCKASSAATLMLIEYALDGANTRPRNDYQAFRPVGDWLHQLNATGWNTVSMHPVPNIPESPSPGYLEFRNNVLVEILRRVANKRRLGSAMAEAMLRSLAARTFRKAGVGEVSCSPLKLIICTPDVKRDGGSSR